jgi:enterochelin esterase-like enzyme
MRLFLLLLAVFSAQLGFGADVVFDLSTGKTGETVFVASELTHWDATQMRMAEVSPGHYQVKISPPWTDSFQYKFVVNGNWFVDPKNSSQADDGEGGMNSVMAVQFDEDPLLNLQPGVKAWVRSTFTVKDSTGADRQIIVMSPPATLRNKAANLHQRTVSVVFNDGTSYLEQGNAAQILANLSNETDMPLMTGVFVDPRDRMTEYAENDPYVSFIADTVMPAFEAKYGASTLASDHLVVGSSLGGLISAYTALKRSDVFGNGASESGSFWWNNEDILPLLVVPPQNLNLYFDVGQYEDPIMLTSNHDARDAAEKNGFHLEYQEFPSFHEFTGWRNRLSLIFRHFFQAN